ncbi:hypothetical protein KJ596_04345 [Patescibacteria group bacterium]|nr:hypothetical protein [Patescibacteria group bacterium]MBU1868315.1 hypothetical protein [Patescibacteria group bacterium]
MSTIVKFFKPSTKKILLSLLIWITLWCSYYYFFAYCFLADCANSQGELTACCNPSRTQLAETLSTITYLFPLLAYLTSCILDLIEHIVKTTVLITILTVLLVILSIIFLRRKGTLQNAEHYTISLSEQISEHPLYFYPQSIFSYDAFLEDGTRIILETQSKVDCPTLTIDGILKKVVLGDGSGKTKEDYTGYHLFADSFKCK